MKPICFSRSNPKKIQVGYNPYLFEVTKLTHVLKARIFGADYMGKCRLADYGQL